MCVSPWAAARVFQNPAEEWREQVAPLLPRQTLDRLQAAGTHAHTRAWIYKRGSPPCVSKSPSPPPPPGWESQLLETGFLGIFLCPLWSLSQVSPRHPPSIISIWTFRWLIVRIMLGAVSETHTLIIIFTFTFCHLADTLIQRDLQ